MRGMYPRQDTEIIVLRLVTFAGTVITSSALNVELRLRGVWRLWSLHENANFLPLMDVSCGPLPRHSQALSGLYALFNFAIVRDVPRVRRGKGVVAFVNCQHD